MIKPKKVTAKRQDPGLKLNFQHFVTKGCVQISFSEITLRRWLKEIETAKKTTR